MLNFREFRDNLCSGCSLCVTTKINYSKSNFCFEAYKTDPALFMSYSYQKLRSITSWPLAYSLDKELFEDTFCKSGVCGKLKGHTCKSLVDCSNILSSQMRVHGSPNINLNNLKLTVKVPTSIMIVGGSDKWVKTVKKME